MASPIPNLGTVLEQLVPKEMNNLARAHSSSAISGGASTRSPRANKNHTESIVAGPPPQQKKNG